MCEADAEEEDYEIRIVTFAVGLEWIISVFISIWFIVNRVLFLKGVAICITREWVIMMKQAFVIVMSEWI